MSKRDLGCERASKWVRPRARPARSGLGTSAPRVRYLGVSARTLSVGRLPAFVSALRGASPMLPLPSPAPTSLSPRWMGRPRAASDRLRLAQPGFGDGLVLASPRSPATEGRGRRKRRRRGRAAGGRTDGLPLLRGHRGGRRRAGREGRKEDAGRPMDRRAAVAPGPSPRRLCPKAPSTRPTPSPEA